MKAIQLIANEYPNINTFIIPIETILIVLISNDYIHFERLIKDIIYLLMIMNKL
jgi:hypothetical protein